MSAQIIRFRPAMTKAQQETNSYWARRLERRRAIASARLAYLLDIDGRLGA